MSIYEEIKQSKVPFIIAEAGVNHNGDMKLAKQLVDAAVEADVDAVKFQTFTAENVVTKNASMASYQEKNTGKVESQLDMIKKFELGFADFKVLKEYCDKKGIMFLSTPHSPDAVNYLDKLVPMYKLGSGDLTNIPFLEDVAKKGKPIIISTGMATLEEVGDAIQTIKSQGNNEIIVLKCTTSYPCDLKDVNMHGMNTVKEKYGVMVGYSDHTLGIDVPKLAAKHGAEVIEKHFTLDKKLPGPDHKASLDPKELSQMVKALKNQDYGVEIDEELVLGSKEIKPTPAEIEIAKVARKSVVANMDIKEGTDITKEMLIIKRPGTGILPKEMKNIVGKKAARDVKEDTLLVEEDFK